MNSSAISFPLRGAESIVEQLRACGRMFHHRGWSLGTSSNYSAVISEDPLELIVTASGKDKSRLQEDDFVRIGADGRPTSPGQPAASAETMLHVALARRGGIGAVLHTHSVWSTILSETFAGKGGLEISGYEMLKGLAGVKTHEHREWLPIFDNTQDIPALARQVDAYLQSDGAHSHGYLIRRHGLYTWGRDLDEASRHIEIFEFLLECVGRSLPFGP
jgi:methylthioribulose-1-phosphate dehydratase